jgi:stearoyl-CoA desaturase (delta-9 desaturase)
VRPVRTPAERKLALINLGAVVVPIVGLIAAVALLWGVAFNWTLLVISVGMSMISALGITVGYHRLCTHRSFKTPAFMRYAFAAAGSMAVQGPVIRWCAEHRRHHQHSDTEGDPHSPHMGAHGSWGDGVWATLKGGYHAHLGWLFAGRSKGLGKYSVDLRLDPALVMADRHFVPWVLAGLVIPAVLGGLLTMSWMGVLLGFLWGGLVRILFVHHITWSVNSICHLFGSRPFDCHDESRNNPRIGILAMGEGWHNNHHAFPTSARHGLRWWELDVSYGFIRLLRAVGLATDVRIPSAARVATKRRERETRSGAHAGTDQGR